MAVTHDPVFVQGYRRLNAVLTAAKTTYSDIANAVALGPSGSNGSQLLKIGALPRATVTATQLQLYLSDGTTIYLIGSALMSAYTMAATTPIPATTFLDVNGAQINDQNPVTLPKSDGTTTWTLYAGAAVALAGGIVVSAEIGDF